MHHWVEARWHGKQMQWKGSSRRRNSLAHPSYTHFALWVRMFRSSKHAIAIAQGNLESMVLAACPKF